MVEDVKEIISKTIKEIEEDWKREWCEKYNIPVEKYNPILQRQIPTSKNFSYIRDLILGGLDNNTINKKLERYRKIRVYKESLDEERDKLKKGQIENLKYNIWNLLEDSLDNNEIRKRLREQLKLIEVNLSKEELDDMREKVKKKRQHNEKFEDLSHQINLAEFSLRDIRFLKARIREENITICPFCYNKIFHLKS